MQKSHFNVCILRLFSILGSFVFPIELHIMYAGDKRGREIIQYYIASSEGISLFFSSVKEAAIGTDFVGALHRTEINVPSSFYLHH